MANGGGESRKDGRTRRRMKPVQAASLMRADIRRISEKRGFSADRLLTHWTEIVGEEVAGKALPHKVSFNSTGLGATLTLLTTGAEAPMLEMQKDAIREKVNTCYGYGAISRIRFTQTGPKGFSDGKITFGRQPKAPAGVEPDPAVALEAADAVKDVVDPDLKQAFERLGRNVLAKPTPPKD